MGSRARALRALRAHAHSFHIIIVFNSSSLKLLRHPASLVSFRQASLDAHLRLHRPTPAWAFLAVLGLPGLSALGP